MNCPRSAADFDVWLERHCVGSPVKQMVPLHRSNLAQFERAPDSVVLRRLVTEDFDAINAAATPKYML